MSLFSKWWSLPERIPRLFQPWPPNSWIRKTFLIQPYRFWLHRRTTKSLNQKCSLKLLNAYLNQADPQFLSPIIDALIIVESRGDRLVLRSGKDSFLKNNRKLDQFHHALVELAKGDPKLAKTRWAYSGIVDISSRKNANAEAKANARYHSLRNVGKSVEEELS